MFDLGWQELAVIFIVALLVFGPEKLPELARAMGKGVAELKRSLQGVKEQIDEEMEEFKEPLREEIEEITKDLPKAEEIKKIVEPQGKEDHTP